MTKEEILRLIDEIENGHHRVAVLATYPGLPWRAITRAPRGEYELAEIEGMAAVEPLYQAHKRYVAPMLDCGGRVRVDIPTVALVDVVNPQEARMLGDWLLHHADAFETTSGGGSR